MITRYVNTDTGSSSPVDPNTDPYDNALNALSPLLATADDITLICSGGTVDTSLVFPNFSGYSFTSLTIIGDWVGASANYDNTLYTLQSFAFRHRDNIVVRNLQLLGPASGSGSSQTLYGGDHAAPATAWAVDVLIDSQDRYSGYTEVRSVYNNAANLTLNLVNCIVRRMNLATTRYGVRNNAGVVNTYNCIFDACQTALRGVNLVQNCAVLNNTTDFNTTTNIFNTASGAGTGTDGITVSNWALEFTDSANGNYNLLSGSQLRDAGLTLPAGSNFDEDVTGAARSQGAGVDVGPYEFTEAGDVTPPVLNSATIQSSGDSIVFAFDENVVIGSGGNGGFTLSLSGGACTATYSSGDGTSSLTYSLSRTIGLHETGTYTYTQPTDGIEDGAGNDLVSIGSTSIVNSSTQFQGTVSADAASYEPGDIITLTLTNFTETPSSVTINGVSASYTGNSSSGTILAPAYNDFVASGSHESTPWQTNITIQANQTGGNASDTIQIDPPSGAEFFDVVVAAGPYDPDSIFFDDVGIEAGDYAIGRVISGTLTDFTTDGILVWSTSSGQFDYKIWDASLGAWSNESSEFFNTSELSFSIIHHHSIILGF